MRAVAIYNPKGGSGKTTTTLNLGFALHKLGYRVMLVDLDPSGSLSSILDVSAGTISTYQWLTKQASYSSFAEVRGVTVVPSSITLAALEVEMSSIKGRETMLKRALADVGEYDYVLLDCPPGFGLLNINALTAASEVIVPVLAEHLDLMVLSRLGDTITAVRKHLNSRLSVLGLFVNRISHRKINKKTLAEINRLFPGLVMNSVVRDNVSITESPAHGLDILSYQADSHGAVDYLLLAKEVASSPPRSDC